MGTSRGRDPPRGPQPGGDGSAVGPSPWNVMIKHRQVQRRGRRSQVTTRGSFTDPVISMELLRAVLQPSIDEDIRTVFGKYLKFFQKAALNVRDNVGDEVETERLIQEACRSSLEQAKLLFANGEKTIPRSGHRAPAGKVGRRPRGASAGEGAPGWNPGPRDLVRETGTKSSPPPGGPPPRTREGASRR